MQKRSQVSSNLVHKQYSSQKQHFFIEYIFGWQGIGKLTIDALNKKDFPVILGSAIAIGVIFVVVNLIVDIFYTRLDPRVKL